MSTKSVRLDTEVIDALRKKTDGRHPNEALRDMLGLSEVKHNRSKLTQDHLSRAKRSLLRAIQEIDAAREERYYAIPALPSIKEVNNDGKRT